MANNVIILYERHTESQPIKVLIELMPFLSLHGVKTHCFEDRSDLNKNDFVAVLNFTIATYREGLKANSVVGPYSKPFLMGVYMNEGIVEKMPKSSHEQVAKMLKPILVEKIEALESSIKLVKVMEQSDVNFCTIDLDTLSQENLEKEESQAVGINRILEKLLVHDKEMTKNILKHTDKGDVSILVGANHFSIANKLRAEGISVKEYYIATTPKDPLIPYFKKADYCVQNNKEDLWSDGDKCSSHELDRLVIDLSKNLHLNASMLIRDDLQMSLYANHFNNEL